VSPFVIIRSLAVVTMARAEIGKWLNLLILKAPFRSRWSRAGHSIPSISRLGLTGPDRLPTWRTALVLALLYKHLEQEAKELHGLQHHELIGELPAALSRGLLTEQFAAHHIADGFGIHVRTLHRRLRAAGTSFRQELDQTRKSVSEQLLGSTSLPVWDIAKALGYSDSSGFIRAFQRWYGVSPSVWRKKNNPLLRKSA
jgi:AraC-like DNA-binding protein